MNPGLLTQKLGKRAPRRDRRTFKLARYLVGDQLPAPATDASFVQKVQDWGMMLNDQLGDCVAAAAGHMIQQWTRYAGREVVVSDADILKTYEDVGGYIPGNPLTDQGMDMLSYLNYWRQTGVGGHKILGYAAIDLANPAELLQAVQLFGNAYIGVALPLTAQGQNVWSVPSYGPNGDGSPGSWGGHCIPIMAFSPRSRLVLSWAAKLYATPNFLGYYMDEAYAVFSSEWLEGSGVSPSGFNRAQLEADLAQL